MNRTVLDEMANALADALRASLCSYSPSLVPLLLRHLAEGRPVSIEQIATALHTSCEEATAALGQLPNVEFDGGGNVVGSGLTLTPTPHRFEAGGQRLFTWCAFDTLFFPVILMQSARVRSACPVTGHNVQLTVTPDKVADLEPRTAVVSIVVPEGSAAYSDIRGAFCNHIRFFRCPEVASRWLAEHEGAVVLPVEEAYQLGHMLTDRLFQESSGT